VNKFLVFNRWGNIVYSKDNYANEWDGKGNNGTDLPDGTYFLILEIPGSELNKGFVELRR
jgi:gliding motility-associated-like protein